MRANSLAEYRPDLGGWNKALAARVLRKIGFGATRQELEEAERLGFHAFIDKLVDDCDFNLPYSKIRQLEPLAQHLRKIAKRPHWIENSAREAHWERPRSNGEFDGYERDTIHSLTNYLYFHFLNGSPVCASMWVILHNWFALQHEAIDLNRYPALTGDYVDLIIKNLVGSFENLLKGMYGNAHMLEWLDNHLNKVKCISGTTEKSPARCFRANQNWARELLELFTTGTNDIFRPGTTDAPSNYTELDIKFLTRAVVGYERFVINHDTRPTDYFLPGPRLKSFQKAGSSSPTQFCKYKRINIVRTSGTPLDDTFPLNKYSNDCMTASGTQWESRFGFNFEGWKYNDTLEYDPENLGTSEGVYLFEGSPWQIGGRDLSNRVTLNSNTLLCFTNGQGIGTPCHFSFVPDRLTAVATNPPFSREQVPVDNLTSHIIYGHAAFPGAGSSTSRKLAIQLLGFFIGHRAANTPSMVYELAEFIHQNGFDLKATLKKLLKSEAIFAEENQGTAVKTPFEWALGFARALRLPQMYNLTDHGHTYATLVTLLDNISRHSGYPNLHMPSVFGVPIPGIQRNTMISNGQSFINTVSIISRARLFNEYWRYMFNFLNRGASLLDQGRDLGSLTIYVPQGSNREVERTEIIKNTHVDLWGGAGTWDPDVRYLAYFYAYPKFFGNDLILGQETRKYARYSGEQFNLLDYFKENRVLQSLDVRTIDAQQLIDELALMLGVDIDVQGSRAGSGEAVSLRDELVKAFVKLRPSDRISSGGQQTELADCWNNFADWTMNRRHPLNRDTQITVTMHAAEAQKRYFHLKFLGLLYAMLLNNSSSWIK